MDVCRDFEAGQSPGHITFERFAVRDRVRLATHDQKHRFTQLIVRYSERGCLQQTVQFTGAGPDQEPVRAAIR